MANHLDQLFNRAGKSIHPIFKLLLNLVGNGNNVIILPRRYDLVSWAGLFYTALQQFNKSKEIKFKDLSFKMGQKILVNDFVCKFHSFDYENEKIRLYVRYSLKSELIQSIPFRQVYKLHPVSPDTRMTITTSWLSNRESSKRKKTIVNDNQEIELAIITKSNLFSNAYEKMKEINKDISSHILCGKLNNEGEIVSINNDSEEFVPNCLLSIDIYRFYHFLDNPNLKPKSLFIDGSSQILEDPDQFNEMILEEQIPTTIFVEHNEWSKARKDLFKEMGFKIILQKSWAKKLNLVESKPFSYVNDVFKSSKNVKVTPIYFKNDYLSKAFSILSNSDCKNEGFKLEEFWTEMMSDLYQTSISINNRQEIISKANIFSKLSKRDKAFNELLESQNFLDKAKEELNISNLKSSYLMNYIRQNPKRKIAIITKNYEEVKKCREFWSDFIRKYSLTNVEILTVKSFVDGFKRYDQVFLSGYLGSRALNQVVRSYSCSNIAVLLWEHEMKNYFFRYYTFNKKRVFFRNFIWPFQETSYSFEQPQQLEKIAEVDPDRVEFKLERNYFNKVLKKAKDSSGEETLLIKFEDSYYGFFTPTYPFYKVDDLRNISSETISKVDANDLMEGDLVIYLRSNREKIRRFVDKELEESNELRQCSRLWKEALQMKYKEKMENFEELFKLLKRNGCKRNKVTIRNWIRKEMIGPFNLDDIDIIAKATDYAPLIERIDEVKDSIKKLRSAHKQASNFIVNELINSIKVSDLQMLKEKQSDMDSFQLLTVKRVYKEEKMIKRVYINKVYERKDDELG